MDTRLPKGAILINPRRPAETAAKFLYWLAARRGLPVLLSREAMHAQIFNFLDEAAGGRQVLPGQSAASAII